MAAQDSFNMSLETFPERSEKQKQKRCAKAQTWQLAFLVSILTLVSMFSLYSLVSEKTKTAKNQTEPQKFETWVTNEDYVPTDKDTKNLTFIEQLALDLVNKMALSGKVVAISISADRNRSPENIKNKSKCWRRVVMKADGDAQMGELVGGLHVGRSIAIRGRVKPNPKSFKVCLLMGNSSSSDVALNLNPLMNFSGNKAVFVRNSFLSGSWGVEERKLDNFPFAPGFYFQMKIHCAADAFTVSVNCIPLLKYKYRVDLNQITHVRVLGDMKLMDVKLM